ncbi:hypothetical protein BDR22DRAFT_190128 [Usnea florida]
MTDLDRRYGIFTFKLNKTTNSSSSVYASVPFKFIIDGKPFYIHADLVSLHSKPLDRMMNGSMTEAQEGFATLKDVDEGTFVRFIEWAHKGYYTAAEFSISIDSPPAPESPIVEEAVPIPKEAFLEPETLAEVAIAEPAEPYDNLSQTEVFGSRIAQSYKKGKKKRIARDTWGNEVVLDDWGLKGNLKEVFKSRTYTVRQGFVETPSPRPNRSAQEDYTDVFLSHAQLYVFADKNDIQPLKTLALEELHAALVAYELYDVRTRDIIELLRYVYANTCEPQEGVDDMRSMMTQYVGIEMDTLMEDAEFGELIIQDGGDLLRDFMRAVTTRI